MREDNGANGITEELSEILLESTLRARIRYTDIYRIHCNQLRWNMVHKRYTFAYQNHSCIRRKLSHRLTLRERPVVFALGQVR